MPQKKAPLTLKEFTKSSLIINYPCNRYSSKTAPQAIGKDGIRTLCEEMEKAPNRCGRFSAQMPNKERT